MPLIQTTNLCKTYFTRQAGGQAGGAQTKAVCGIDLTIEPGEFVAVMGPSGSGKSTLLHILGFLDRPTGGEYFFDGKTMGDYSEDEMASVRNQKMGFVFQSFNLLPRTSVLENVKLPLLYSKIKPSQWNQISLKAIDAVGLSHRINYASSQLSGGEKQRVAIARALVNNPKVIFADEPTGNLDSKTSHQIMDFVAELHKQGKTIILITHEDDIAKYAKRVIRLRDGKIEEDKLKT
ncbi:MAG: ABC transporter ATP-binding protein [Candidatus Jacksonbacteria bacterium]